MGSGQFEIMTAPSPCSVTPRGIDTPWALPISCKAGIGLAHHKTG